MNNRKALELIRKGHEKRGLVLFEKKTEIIFVLDMHQEKIYT
jgi:hypothetical protein